MEAGELVVKRQVCERKNQWNFIETFFMRSRNGVRRGKDEMSLEGGLSCMIILFSLASPPSCQGEQRWVQERGAREGVTTVGGRLGRNRNDTCAFCLLN